MIKIQQNSNGIHSVIEFAFCSKQMGKLFLYPSCWLSLCVTYALFTGQTFAFPAKYLHKYKFHFNFEPLVSPFKCSQKQGKRTNGEKKVLFSRFGIKRKQRKENEVVVAKVFQFVCNTSPHSSPLAIFPTSLNVFFAQTFFNFSRFAALFVCARKIKGKQHSSNRIEACQTFESTAACVEQFAVKLCSHKKLLNTLIKCIKFTYNLGKCLILLCLGPFLNSTQKYATLCDFVTCWVD